MKKYLIMLTSGYPYGNSEPFIGNEIGFLSRSFDKIIILAQELSPSATVTRDIPDNAEAYNIAQKNKKIARAGDLLRGGLRIFKPSEAYKADKKRTGSSLSKRVFCEYFEKRSVRQYEESVEILSKYDLSEFDEIVIYSFWFFSVCRTGILLKDYLKGKGYNVKIFSRAHGYDLYEYINRLNYLPLREMMAKDVDKIFPCSQYGTEYLKKLLPDYADKIERSYMGTFDHGLSRYDSTFHIVTCSRTVEIKRLDRLVNSLAALKDTGMEIYWTHIGDGPLQDKIKSLSNEKLSFMNCEFLGNLSVNEVFEYYKTHPINLFVNTSRSEGLAVSIMEACSFGIPVLATDVGGTNEIVEDGYNGLLLSKDFDADEFKEKLSILYNADAETIKAFRENARKTWEEKFNAEKNYPVFCAEISGAEYATK